MSRRIQALVLVLLLLLLRAAASSAQTSPAQTPPPTPTPASEPATEPTPAVEPPPPVEPPAAPADSRALLDQLGGCVESGTLNVEIDLQDGRVPAAAGWAVETKGSPVASLKVEAAEGRVKRLHIGVARGATFLVAGSGLKPKVYIESVAFEDGKGITEARFRGKGIWRPIVAIFRGLAMSALRKLEFKTDIPSVLRGEIFAARTAAGKAGASAAAPVAPSPTPPPASAAAAGPSFMDLVREARLKDSELVAFAGKPLGFGEMVQFQTASNPKTGVPLRVAVDEGSFQPGHGSAAARMDVAGRIDGEVENGAVAFIGSKSTFSHGELKGGTFRVRSGEEGKLETSLSASTFALDLTSGEFRLPGGPRVGVQAPSRFAVRDLAVTPDGKYSGLVDADLFGKVGSINRGGTAVSASNVKMRTKGARFSNGRVNGDVDLEFGYRVDYQMVLHYPVEQIPERRVELVFEGPFTTRLHLENAGAGDEGVVTGEYSFKVPWPPVELAALELLRAKWSQDVPAVVKKVDFSIEPRHFSPCGENCFVLNLEVTAEKKKAKGNWFRQVCQPEGKADLVVDAPTRSFQLKNIRIEPRCKGIVGWVINFISPLLTKSYTDMTLFQMPAGLPFTIEKVGTGANWILIGGKVLWSAEAGAGAKPSQ